MGWADSVPQLSTHAVETIVAWALGQKAGPLGDHFALPDWPDDAIACGPAGVIDYAIEYSKSRFGVLIAPLPNT